MYAVILLSRHSFTKTLVRAKRMKAYGTNQHRVDAMCHVGLPSVITSHNVLLCEWSTAPHEQYTLSYNVSRGTQLSLAVKYKRESVEKGSNRYVCVYQSAQKNTCMVGLHLKSPTQEYTCNERVMRSTQISIYTYIHTHIYIIYLVNNQTTARLTKENTRYARARSIRESKEPRLEVYNDSVR